ncbi:MAG: patatin family protein [Lachnospiraceae bacterium]|nr:patatin family protein [Lachnospiraceae bacterium]
MVDNSCGLILEGGALRSVFSAGILDFFLEKGIQIPNVLAISAGAYAGMNYVSGQKGRCLEAIVEPLRRYRYVGIGTWLKTGALFDMDFLFQQVPKEVPFDFETFQNSGKRFITSTVDCEKGEAVYFEDFRSEEEFFKICQAANSLPLIAKITEIDGKPMLDGGMADAIPIVKALEEGWKKVIVVFTREASYRKKDKPFDLRLTNLLYRKYPNFIQLISGRGKRYNEAIETIARLEEEGRAFVFRPTKLKLKNKESNVDKLMEYYNHGYEIAKERYQELLQFLEK